MGTDDRGTVYGVRGTARDRQGVTKVQIPIGINWNEIALAIRRPYNECGTCNYVGPEIQANGQCPSCGTEWKHVAHRVVGNSV